MRRNAQKTGCCNVWRGKCFRQVSCPDSAKGSGRRMEEGGRRGGQGNGREGLSGLPLSYPVSILPFFTLNSCRGVNTTPAASPTMRFHLVDRIVEWAPGKSLRAVKNLPLGEEYLADHFPTFPVMPGVLMLHTLVEAAAWLLRLSEDFRHSVIVLREAKNVKYGTFMQPGKQMSVEVELAEQNETATFKGKGEVGGASTVSARFTLDRYNLRDRNPAFASADERIIHHLRHLSVGLTKQGAAKRGAEGTTP